jgi:hypothetical protein
MACRVGQKYRALPPPSAAWPPQSPVGPAHLPPGPHGRPVCVGVLPAVQMPACHHLFSRECIFWKIRHGPRGNIS